MTRDQVIDSLVSNCDCFDEEDRDTLNSFEDRKLAALHQQLLGNVVYEDEMEGGTEEEDPEEEEDTVPAKKPGGFLKGQRPMAANRRRAGTGDQIAREILSNRRRPMTAQEWFDTAPPEIGQAVQNAMKLEKETKKALLEKLTANVADDRVSAVLNSLKDKSIPELENLLALLPAPRAINAPSFIGAAVPFPGQTTNEQAISKDDPDTLPLPTINYAAEYGNKKKATASA